MYVVGVLVQWNKWQEIALKDDDDERGTFAVSSSFISKDEPVTFLEPVRVLKLDDLFLVEQILRLPPSVDLEMGPNNSSRRCETDL